MPAYKVHFTTPTINHSTSTGAPTSLDFSNGENAKECKAESEMHFFNKSLITSRELLASSASSAPLTAQPFHQQSSDAIPSVSSSLIQSTSSTTIALVEASGSQAPEWKRALDEGQVVPVKDLHVGDGASSLLPVLALMGNGVSATANEREQIVYISGQMRSLTYRTNVFQLKNCCYRLRLISARELYSYKFSKFV